MKHKRRALLLAVAAWPLAAISQQPKKIYRIGYLAGPRGGRDRNFETFRQRLQELGYVEGKNVTIEYRTPEGTHEDLLVLAAALVKSNVDVICTNSTPAAFAAKRATQTIPIVF